jgi:hypothetical protein
MDENHADGLAALQREAQAAQVRSLQAALGEGVKRLQPVHPIIVPQLNVWHLGIGLRAHLVAQALGGVAAGLAGAGIGPEDTAAIDRGVGLAFTLANRTVDGMQAPPDEGEHTVTNDD